MPEKKRKRAPLADRGFYLPGGSALCLRLADGRSVDLVLFREVAFNPRQLPRELDHDRVVFWADVRSFFEREVRTVWNSR